MSKRELHVFRESDLDLLHKLCDIADEAGIREGALSATAVQGMSGLSFKVDKLEDHIGSLSKSESLLGQVQLAGKLEGQGGHVTIEVLRQARHDVVEIRGGGTASFEAVARVLRATSKHFQVFNRPERIEQALGEEMAEFYQRRESALLRLEDATQRLVERQAQYQKELIQDTERLRQELQERAADHRAKLDAVDEARRKNWQQRHDELDALQKSLDDRAAKHARRDNERRLKEELAKLDTDFRLSRGTQNKRLGIHIAFGTVILVSLASTAWLLLSEWDVNSIPMWIKLGLGSLSFFGFSTAYLGWMNHWFRQHADEEFRLKRLSIDIVRASWLVETVSEWQAEHPDAPLPDELLRQVGGGLFEREDAHHEDDDLLAKLVGAASRLQVNTPTTQFEFDRKSKRKLDDKSE